MDEPQPLAKPVRARGKARRYSNEKLREVTSPDALRAQLDAAGEDWQENAPKAYSKILEAKEIS